MMPHDLGNGFREKATFQHIEFGMPRVTWLSSQCVGESGAQEGGQGRRKRSSARTSPGQCHTLKRAVPGHGESRETQREPLSEKARVQPVTGPSTLAESSCPSGTEGRLPGPGLCSARNQSAE